MAPLCRRRVWTPRTATLLSVFGICQSLFHSIPFRRAVGVVGDNYLIAVFLDIKNTVNFCNGITEPRRLKAGIQGNPPRLSAALRFRWSN